MKKYLWIVALIAALAMVMAGCDNGGGGGGTTTTQDGEYKEFFRLTTDVLEPMIEGGLTVGTALDKDSDFDGLPIQVASQDGVGFEIKIVANGSTYAFEIKTGTQNWGAGLDLKQKDLKFQKLDKVKVTGRLLAELPADVAGSYSSRVYLETNTNNDGKRPEIETNGVGAFEKEIILSASDVVAINNGSPSAIRIGGIPANVEFSIDEVVVMRWEAKEAATKYTVTFFESKTATSALGSVEVEEDSVIPALKDLQWHKDFLSGLDSANKEFIAWYNKADDTAWVLTTTLVKANVSLYAEVETKEAPATTLTALTFDSGSTKQFTITSGLTDTTYLVVKFTATNSLNGVGGLQIGFNGAISGSSWKDVTLTSDWQDLQPALGAYNGSAVIFFVIKLAAIDGLTLTGGGGQIILNTPEGWTDNGLTYAGAWLADGKPTKPADEDDFVVAARDGVVYGWFANDIGTLTP